MTQTLEQATIRFGVSFSESGNSPSRTGPGGAHPDQHVPIEIHGVDRVGPMVVRTRPIRTGIVQDVQAHAGPRHYPAIHLWKPDSACAIVFRPKTRVWAEGSPVLRDQWSYFNVAAQ